MKPHRIQRKRTKGWRMPPNTVYVGRPTGWGNPFVPASAFESEGVKIPEITATSAVHLYRERLEGMIETYPHVRKAVNDLRGKNLACWCPLDQPCHADVLLELANR